MLLVQRVAVFAFVITALRAPSIGGSCTCSEPVAKVTPLTVLPIGKLITKETSRKYLVRYVRLMRCPNHLGCCGTLRQHCAPTAVEEVTMEIPVEVLIGRHEYEYINETHTFSNHLRCACKMRTPQAFANYLARELVKEFEPEGAVPMARRVCRATQRRVRKFQRFGTHLYGAQRTHRRRLTETARVRVSGDEPNNKEDLIC